MKKLAVLLQVVGLVALCPIYVILEITHSTRENLEMNAGSQIKPKTAIKSSQEPKISGNMQNTASYSNTK